MIISRGGELSSGSSYMIEDLDDQKLKRLVRDLIICHLQLRAVS